MGEVELIYHPEAFSYSHIQEIACELVHSGYEIFGRETLVDTPGEQGFVALACYYHSERLSAVAPSASGFLIVFFK